ncbi:MAG TPA: SRPBCC domain-containing protein [bacterium]|nr:SRPBCC domain-containing protein [bacterium]
MKDSKKTMELKFERIIPAPPGKVFDGWLSPKTPGTPWHEKQKLLLSPKVDGFFYWLINGTAHYGRFTQIERPRRIQHTWMSRYTSGEESTVTVTFKQKGADTLMTLVHSGLPKNELSKAHKAGWNYFLDKLAKTFSGESAKSVKEPKGWRDR